jgi:hypothetical protein
MVRRAPLIRSAIPLTMVASRSAPVNAKGALCVALTALVGVVTRVVAVFVPPLGLVPVATKVVIALNATVSAGPPFSVRVGSPLATKFSVRTPEEPTVVTRYWAPFAVMFTEEFGAKTQETWRARVDPVSTTSENEQFVFDRVGGGYEAPAVETGRPRVKRAAEERVRSPKPMPAGTFLRCLIVLRSGESMRLQAG